MNDTDKKYLCCDRIHQDIIQKAKKEVFDDIKREIPRVSDWEKVKGLHRINIFEELKKRHLSTFAKSKSDIIARKH